MRRRRSTARASELLFIARHSFEPDRVFKEFRHSPLGGTFSDGRIQFEWGNINTLVSSRIHRSAKTVKITANAKHIYHLDRLKKSRRQVIESTHSLPPGSITGSLSSSKADVLIVDHTGKKYFVSFKEIEGQAKLGQLSAETKFGMASLDGGIDDLDTKTLPIPKNFDYKSTSLSAESFAGVSSKDQKLAYFKKNHHSDWSSYVDRRTSEAAIQLREFAEVMCGDRESFISFVGTTLAGSLLNSPDFFIVIGNEVVHLQTVLDQLRSPRWLVTTCDASTPKKHAILLMVRDSTRSYTLTRVEQSFEGARPRVSQTKGIVYHFQQHPRSGPNYKQLLLDLSQ